MEWKVHHESGAKEPWCVFKAFGMQRVFEKRFASHSEAVLWAERKEKMHHYPQGVEAQCIVDEASFESFPASDAPAWISSNAGSGRQVI